jgi:hypothetical protein
MENKCECHSCDCVNPESVKPTGCCPIFNPEPWDGKEVTLDNRMFIKDHVTSVFHIPLNFGQKMTSNMAKIDQAGARLMENILVLSDEKSMWGSDLYIAVAKEVPGVENVKLSGTFLTKVFEGEYKNMGNWLKQMKEYVNSNGKTVKKLYFYYTTCPKCSKKYGHNYVVVFAQVG